MKRLKNHIISCLTSFIQLHLPALPCLLTFAGSRGASLSGTSQSQFHLHAREWLKNIISLSCIRRIFIFSSLSLLLVVDMVNGCGRKHHAKSRPYHKHLYLFGRNSYLSATIQFRFAYYQALMPKYNHANYTKLNLFTEHLLAKQREQFQAIYCRRPAACQNISADLL